MYQGQISSLNDTESGKLQADAASPDTPAHRNEDIDSARDFPWWDLKRTRGLSRQPEAQAAKRKRLSFAKDRETYSDAFATATHPSPPPAGHRERSGKPRRLAGRRAPPAPAPWDTACAGAASLSGGAAGVNFDYTPFRLKFRAPRVYSEHPQGTTAAQRRCNF